MKLNKTPKYATALLCALSMASAVPTISVYAAQDTYSTFSTGKKTARMRDAAESVQLAFEQQDLGKLAGLCAYPLVISYADGTIEEIPDQAGFLALGDSLFFTRTMLDSVASTNVAKLTDGGSAGVQMGADYGLSLYKIKGKWKINNFILDSSKQAASASLNVSSLAQMAELVQKTFSYQDLETLSKMCNYPVVITYADGKTVEYNTPQQIMALDADKVFTGKLLTAIDQTDVSSLKEVGSAGAQMGDSSGLSLYRFNGYWKINQIYQ